MEHMDSGVADLSGIQLRVGGEVGVSRGALEVDAVPVEFNDDGNAAVGENAHARGDLDGGSTHRSLRGPTRLALFARSSGPSRRPSRRAMRSATSRRQGDRRPGRPR